jgi:SAM-dependent methyltransferase
MKGTQMTGAQVYFDQVLHEYARMEPGETDTWNPVCNETELGYRLTFLFALTKCLELCEIPLRQLRVLDVGCGNGRSTRLYLDLGLSPDQLTGLDLRPGAIALARKLNPAVDFRTYDGYAIDFPAPSFNWVQFSTVFSSVADHGHRAHLVAEACKQLQSGGYLFYLDLWRANGFAGGDVLRPESMFSSLRVVWASPLRAHQCFPAVRNRWLFLRRDRTRLQQFRAWVALRTRLHRLRYPSHYVMLARKVQ